MAGAIHKMAVYLGLVEDEVAYEDGYDSVEEDYAGHPSALRRPGLPFAATDITRRSPAGRRATPYRCERVSRRPIWLQPNPRSFRPTQ